MSKVSAKQSDHRDEAYIWGLTIQSSYPYPDEELTKVDLHIKLTEAKDLCEALQEIFKVQAKGQSGDKSLPQSETSTP